MKFALFSPPPIYRPVAVPRLVRFGEEKNQGQKNKDTQEVFSGDCGGRCQGHCGQCATAAAKREAIRQANERRRRILAEKLDQNNE